MKAFLGILMIIVIILMWTVIVIHPVVISLWKDNPLWMLLYLGIIPEVLLGVFLTKLGILIIDEL